MTTTRLRQSALAFVHANAHVLTWIQKAHSILLLCFQVGMELAPHSERIFCSGYDPGFFVCLGSYLSHEPCWFKSLQMKMYLKKGVERLLSDCSAVAECFCRMSIFLSLFLSYVFVQDLNKCFKCDSQRPYDAYHHDSSHRVENVIDQRDSRGEFTWWQSVNGAWGLCFETKSLRSH